MGYNCGDGAEGLKGKKHTNMAGCKILKEEGWEAGQASWEASGHGSELPVTALMTELVADGSSAALQSQCQGLQRLTLPCQARRCRMLMLIANANTCGQMLSLTAHHIPPISCVLVT